MKGRKRNRPARLGRNMNPRMYVTGVHWRMEGRSDSCFRNTKDQHYVSVT
jgi:hypothetical protein